MLREWGLPVSDLIEVVCGETGMQDYFDRIALKRLRMSVTAELDAARWEPGTLYVLRDEHSIAIVAARFDPARDLLRRIDGLMVFAPGWHGR